MTFWERVTSVIGAHRVLSLLRYYPPYLGAGIRVLSVDPAFREIEVALKLTPWNQNYVGTHFGGSLYSMCDPFYMLMVIQALGPEYVVWDKSASIDFLRPGRGTVRARFRVTDADLTAMKEEVTRAGKAHPRFEVAVLSESGEPIARITKVLSVKKRR